MKTITYNCVALLIVSIYVLLEFPLYVNGRPEKVGCDLIGESSLNVMERTVIMNQKPEDVYNLIFKEKVELDANDQTKMVVSLRVSNLKHGGAVIHSSHGNLQMISNGFIKKNCDKFESSVYYTQINIPKDGNVMLTLTVPIDSPPVYISVLTGTGYGKITRQRKLVFGTHPLHVFR
jgi:hypothetical protein